MYYFRFKKARNKGELFLMGFTAYRTKDEEGKKLPKHKWLIDSIYHDPLKGGKAREKEYAKALEQSGCKIVWNKVK